MHTRYGSGKRAHWHIFLCHHRVMPRSALSLLTALAVALAPLTAAGVPLAGSAQAASVPTPTATAAARAELARMTLSQRVGQLFMVGTPATVLTPEVVQA